MSLSWGFCSREISTSNDGYGFHAFTKAIFIFLFPPALQAAEYIQSAATASLHSYLENF